MKKFAFTLTLILWSISMAASTSANSAVLCVEKDGKAVIEYSVDTHCDEVKASVTPTGKSVQTVVHCTDCVDSSLTSSASSYSPRPADEAAPLRIAGYIVAYLDAAYLQDAMGIHPSAPLLEHAAMRSTYMGQRQTIVIQQ